MLRADLALRRASTRDAVAYWRGLVNQSQRHNDSHGTPSSSLSKETAGIDPPYNPTVAIAVLLVHLHLLAVHELR